MSDVFLAGHAHNYQRYTRTVTVSGTRLEIPFIVAGTGGRNDQPIGQATGQQDGDHTFVASRQGFGYLLVEANSKAVAVRCIGLDAGGVRLPADADRVAIDLATHTVR